MALYGKRYSCKLYLQHLSSICRDIYLPSLRTTQPFWEKRSCLQWITALKWTRLLIREKRQIQQSLDMLILSCGQTDGAGSVPCERCGHFSPHAHFLAQFSPHTLFLAQFFSTYTIFGLLFLHIHYLWLNFSPHTLFVAKLFSTYTVFGSIFLHAKVSQK